MKKKGFKAHKIYFYRKRKSLNSFIPTLFPMKIISADVREKASSTPWSSYKIQLRKPAYSTGLKIITPKQISQNLTMSLAQAKADNTSKKL